MTEHKLLEQVGNLVREYKDDCRKNALNFNVFWITGIDDKEVIMCRVLHELLNPLGNHGMGTVYLKQFIEHVLQLDDILDDEISKAKVFREYKIPGSDRRIDLVVETRSRFIPIEVKIYAREQESQ